MHMMTKMQRANPTPQAKTAVRTRRKAASSSAPLAAQPSLRKQATKAGPKPLAAARDAQPSREAGISVGVQLRHYRLSRKLKLKELADLAGCSESLLSRIENNQVNPSFTTLHRLCKSLEISVSNMMAATDESHCVISRPGERLVVGRGGLRDPEHSEAEVFIPYRDGRLLEGLLVTLRPGGNSNGFVSHRGEEVGYVLEGEFELTVEDTTHRLGPGCTFFFRSDIPHSYRNPGRKATRVLWINTPPSF